MVFFHLLCASSCTTQNSDHPGDYWSNSQGNLGISAKSIAKQLGISRERVGSNIHEDLDMRKLSAKWVPKCLNADQKHQRCQSSEQLLEFFLARQCPSSPGTSNPEETGRPGLPVSSSPTLFSRSGPVGLPPVPWTEKIIERSPFFVWCGGHCCRGNSSMHNLLNFFWVACKS